jgi:hypothetical protein
MNRKFRFPCAQKHYLEAPKGPDGKYMFWSKEECEKMYDPSCAECRENFKRPGNHALFDLYWWNRRYNLNHWIFSKSKWRHAYWYFKNRSKWIGIKKIFWDAGHYDQYQHLHLPFFTINWAPLEFDDIRREWVDLNKYHEHKPYKRPWWRKKPEWETAEWLEQRKEDVEITKHLIRVAYRFQRMWEKQLKEKLNCRESIDDTPCQFGTWGCKVNHNEVK